MDKGAASRPPTTNDGEPEASDPMEPADLRKLRFEWLNAELTLANERISAYSEADQKVITVIATLIVALIGFATSKYGEEAKISVSSAFFLSSGLMSLAVTQTSVYSSLTLLFMERKVKISRTIAELLECDEDYAHSRYSISREASFRSYKISAYPYYIFKATGGLALSLAGLFGAEWAQRSPLFWLAFGATFLFALTCAGIIVMHLRYIKRFNDRLKGPDDGSGDPIRTPTAGLG